MSKPTGLVQGTLDLLIPKHRLLNPCAAGASLSASRRSQGGGLGARKAFRFELDNKSTQWERDKACFKSDGTELKCL